MASFPKAGPPGQEGPIGPAGPQGVQGPIGKEGQQGPDGKGTVGAEGPQGLAGPQGNVGPAGPQGNAGPQGIQGVKGDVGATGAKGETGATGAKGETGATPTTMPESGVVGLVADLAAKASKASLEAEELARTNADALLTPLTVAEAVARQGLPAKMWPALTGFQFKMNTTLQTVNLAKYVRFVPIRNMTVRGLTVVTTVAATANDNCAVGIRDTNGKTLLASSGSVAGKMNATAGRQDIDFTADLALEAGRAYYAGFQYGASIGGTAATLVNIETSGLFGIIGSAVGELISMTSTPTFPFATEPTPSATSTVLYTAVRER